MNFSHFFKTFSHETTIACCSSDESLMIKRMRECRWKCLCLCELITTETQIHVYAGSSLALGSLIFRTLL